MWLGILIFLSSSWNKVFGKTQSINIWHSLLYFQHDCFKNKHLIKLQTPGDVCVQTHNVRQQRRDYFYPKKPEGIVRQDEGKKNQCVTLWQTETTGIGGHCRKLKTTGKERDDRIFQAIKITQGSVCASISHLKKNGSE